MSHGPAALGEALQRRSRGGRLRTSRTCRSKEARARGSKVAVFFGDLFKAISAHFALEERIMRERGCDQLMQHKNDHERLLDEIRDIMEDYEVTDLLDEQLLSQRLDAWFSRHFETHDARLHHALGHR